MTTREQRALELARDAAHDDHPGTWPCGSCTVIAAAILRAMDEERERTLEEAAQAIDTDEENQFNEGWNIGGRLAAAIRALKQESPARTRDRVDAPPGDDREHV